MELKEMIKDIEIFIKEKKAQGIICATKTNKQKELVKLVYMPELNSYMVHVGPVITEWAFLDDACEDFLSQY